MDAEHRSVAHRLAAVAAHDPDAAALRCGDVVMTRGGLHRAAGRLARRIDDLRLPDLVRADDPAPDARPPVIAVTASPGIDLVVAMLGAWHARAVVCAVDPRWPRARIDQALDHLRPVAHLVDRPVGWDTAREHRIADLRTGGDDTPPDVADPTSPAACVFHTSGSTGRPKAVLAPHDGILRIADDPTVATGSAILAASPASWDAFAFEMWVGLARGACVHILDGGPLDARGLEGAIAAGVDTVFLTTAVFTALATGDIAVLGGLRHVLTGGERCRSDLLRACHLAHPDLTLQHVYGPAEATIFTTVHTVDDGTGPVPIGRPVHDTEVALLDPSGEPVAPGEVGELVVAGPGIALGYLDDPEATAAAFRTAQVAGRTTRAYFTGDHCRLDDRGDLVFVGRVDRQVKVRGVRVELDEVEHVLERMTELDAVSVQSDPDGLVAHVVPAAGADPGRLATLVRDHVAAHLPQAFVPRVVDVLDTIPITAVGKVDRAALAARRRIPETTHPRIPPALAALIDVPVGPDDDIFAAGATSLTAIRIAVALRDPAGRAVDVRDVIAARTVARILRLGALATPDGPVATAAPTDRTSARWVTGIPLPQWRFWFLEHRMPGNPDLHNVFRFGVAGSLDVDAFRDAVMHVVAAHDALRTRIVRESRHCVRSDIVPAADISGDDIVRIGADGSPTADTDHGSDRFPIRVDVVGGDHRFTIVVDVHHIAFDGWSAHLLFDAVGAAYDALVDGRVPAPTAPTSYVDAWASCAPEADDTEALMTWTRRLAGVRDLPVLGPSSGSGPAAAVVTPCDPSPDLTAAVQETARRRSTTVTAVLLAAWVRALRPYAGDADLAVAMPVDGRATEAAAVTIGPFTSSVALRFEGIATTPEDDIDAAHREISQALAHRVMPIERFLREDGPRDPDRMPYAQAGLVVQESGATTLRLGGLDVRSEGRVLPTTGFELTLEVVLGGGISGRVIRRADVLDDDEGRRLAARWINAVTTLTAD